MNFLVSPDLSAEKLLDNRVGLVQRGQTSADDFQPSPIEPSWILEGNPIARSLGLTRAYDGNFTSGLWDCTAGKFNYHYGCDEVVHILEGEAIVEETSAGLVHVLRAGDVALFPQGLTLKWTVPQYVRKLAIFRSVKARLVRRICAKLWRMARAAFKFVR